LRLRRQEIGDRRQEIGDRSQETGVRSQESGELRKKRAGRGGVHFVH